MRPAWFAGRVLDLHEVSIDPRDRGFLLGDGVFETMRFVHGRVVSFDEHMARLEAGCHLLGFTFPGFAYIKEAVGSLLNAAQSPEAVLRLTLTRGVSGRGLLPQTTYHPCMLITLQPSVFHFSHVHLVTARSVRRDETSPLCRVKNLNALTAILARQEAVKAGADDALLLNTQGEVAEGTVSNVVVQLKGKLYTPPVEAGALPGTARSRLMKQMALQVTTLTVKDLLNAQGVWLINALSLQVVDRLDATQLHQQEAVTRHIKRILSSS